MPRESAKENRSLAFRFEETLRELRELTQDYTQIIVSTGIDFLEGASQQDSGDNQDFQKELALIRSGQDQLKQEKEVAECLKEEQEKRKKERKGQAIQSFLQEEAPHFLKLFRQFKQIYWKGRGELFGYDPDTGKFNRCLGVRQSHRLKGAAWRERVYQIKLEFDDFVENSSVFRSVTITTGEKVIYQGNYKNRVEWVKKLRKVLLEAARGSIELDYEIFHDDGAG